MNSWRCLETPRGEGRQDLSSRSVMLEMRDSDQGIGCYADFILPFALLLGPLILHSATTMLRCRTTSSSPKVSEWPLENVETSDTETASTMDDSDVDVDVSSSESVSDEEIVELTHFEDKDFNAYDWQCVSERLYFVFCCADDAEE